MVENDLLTNFIKMLECAAPLEVIRKIENDDDIDYSWNIFDSSGFLDILVAEKAGGAGLSLAAAAPLIEELGAQLFPAPAAQTMMARALLTREGIEPPSGPILLAGYNAVIPFAELAGHALVAWQDKVNLIKINTTILRPMGLYGSRSAKLEFASAPEVLVSLLITPETLRASAAVLRAAEIAGMAGAVLRMTVAYANERIQFGKPIGKQQAIQQQLAILAEQALLARMAARLGCAAGLPPTTEAAAAAKLVASASVPLVTNIAHAVHGAIGISEEYNLQLFTRRLYEARLADGADGYWATLLGARHLAGGAATSLDFVRATSPV